MVANVFAARIPVWRTCMVVLLLVGLFACQAAASTYITSMVVTNRPDCVRICVQGTAPLQMSPLQSSRYVGFQFAGRLTAKGGFVSIHSGRIYSVRYSRFRENPPLSRVVLNTSGTLDYSTEWSSDRTQVTISVWKFGAKPTVSVPEKPVARRPIATATAPVSDLPVLPPAEISGPQGSDPGTPDPEPVRLAAAPMRIAGPASSAPISIAQVTSLTARSTALVQPVRIARVPDAPVRMAQATIAPVVLAATEKRVSLNFLGADINDVLKALASQSGENIVASKDVKGEVTVSLSDVTLEEALDYVAKLSGFGYTKSNGTYLVGSKDSLKQMRSVEAGQNELEFIWLQYASAVDVKNLLNASYPQLQVSLLGQRGQESEPKPQAATRTSLFSETSWMREAPPSSDLVALSGSRAMIEEAKTLITRIEDSIRQQKEMARKWIDGKQRGCYKVKYANPAQLAQTLTALVPSVAVAFAPANDWELVGFKSVKAGEDGIPAVEREIRDPTNKNLWKDTDAATAKQAGDAKAGDASSGSQLTEATSRTLIILGNEEAVAKALATAADLDIKPPQISVEAKITSIDKSSAEQLGLKWNWGEFTKLEVSPSHWQRQPVAFGATLEAMITKGDAFILASPNLLCVEGKPGIFFVGDEMTYVSSVSASAGGEKTYNTSTARAGVSLTVVSSVSADGYITLYLHAEVSGLTLTTQGGVTLPTVSRRYTDQVVRVKSGSTIAIGGLIRNDEIDSMSKIPLLGDLPFFGKLFRHKETSSKKNEVVMFITASIVKDQE